MAATIAIAVSISAVFTFVITRLWDAYRMEKKYVQLETCEVRMNKRDQFEDDIKDILKKINKRLMLGNLIMADLCEINKIPASRVESYEKSLQIKLRENMLET